MLCIYIRAGALNISEIGRKNFPFSSDECNGQQWWNGRRKGYSELWFSVAIGSHCFFYVMTVISMHVCSHLNKSDQKINLKKRSKILKQGGFYLTGRDFPFLFIIQKHIDPFLFQFMLNTSKPLRVFIFVIWAKKLLSFNEHIPKRKTLLGCFSLSIFFMELHSLLTPLVHRIAKLPATQ